MFLFYFVIFVCLPHTLLSLEKKSEVKHRNLLSWPNTKDIVCCKITFFEVFNFHSYLYYILSLISIKWDPFSEIDYLRCSLKYSLSIKRLHSLSNQSKHI